LAAIQLVLTNPLRSAQALILLSSSLDEIQPTVWLSLTFDHRVADGAVAAQLLEATVKHLQNKKSLTAA